MLLGFFRQALVNNPFEVFWHSGAYGGQRFVLLVGNGIYDSLIDLPSERRLPFRFNRRKSRSRGKLFHRLAQQAVAVDPVPYKCMVGGVENKDVANHKK